MNPVRLGPDELRALLDEARLMLIFTPAVCGERDAREVLEAALEGVDVVQVRPKALGGNSPCGARETFDLALIVLDVVAANGAGARVPVIVNDRVDVALALADRGCAGVHLGQEDCPPRAARELLGPRALIGWSTHSMAQVALAGEEPVDYIGFGPIHATRTKGYERSHGTEACWVATNGASVPVFPIGGIDATNAGDLAEVGRAAVSAAVLRADDPGRAARELRELLGGGTPPHGRNSIASP